MGNSPSLSNYDVFSTSTTHEEDVQVINSFIYSPFDNKFLFNHLFVGTEEWSNDWEFADDAIKHEIRRRERSHPIEDATDNVEAELVKNPSLEQLRRFQMNLLRVTPMQAPQNFEPYHTLLLRRIRQLQHVHEALCRQRQRDKNMREDGKFINIDIGDVPANDSRRALQSLHRALELSDSEEQACCGFSLHRRTRLTTIYNILAQQPALSLRGEQLDEIHKFLLSVITGDQPASKKPLAIGGLLYLAHSQGSLSDLLNGIYYALVYRAQAQQADGIGSEWDDCVAAILTVLRTLEGFRLKPLTQRGIANTSNHDINNSNNDNNAASSVNYEGIQSMVDRRRMSLDEATCLIFAELDRLLSQHQTDHDVLTTTTQSNIINRPFCVEIHENTFSALHLLLVYYSKLNYQHDAVHQEKATTSRATSNSNNNNASDGKQLSRNVLAMYSAIVCLRLLRKNITELSRISEDNSHSQIKHIFEKLRAQDSSGQEFMSLLRNLLLRFVHGKFTSRVVAHGKTQMDPRSDAIDEYDRNLHEQQQSNFIANNIEAETDQILSVKPLSSNADIVIDLEGPDPEDEQDEMSKYRHKFRAALKIIEQEAAGVLSYGFTLFYPSLSSRISFMEDLLSGSVALASASASQPSRQNRLLLDSLLKRLISSSHALEMLDINTNSSPTRKPQFLFALLDTIVCNNKARLCKAYTPGHQLDSSPENATVTAEHSQEDVLLFSFQSHLMSLAWKASTSKDPAYQTFIAYSRKLIESCLDLLEFVKRSFASEECDSSELASPHAVPEWLKANVDAVLRSSILGYHFPVLVVGLLPFFSHPRIHDPNDCLLSFASTILPKITATLSVIGNLNKSLQLEQLQVTKVIETPHPYPANTDEIRNYKYDGALFLSLKFDDKSCTRLKSDFLEISQSSARTNDTSQRFSGNNSSRKEARGNWPIKPVVIPGDSVTFHFHSDVLPVEQYASDNWGFRCLVTPFYTIHWLLELEKSLACLGAKVAAVALVGGSITEKEDSNVSWLDSELFAAGLEPFFLHQQVSGLMSTTKIYGDHGTFLEDLVENRNDAASLLRFVSIHMRAELAFAAIGGDIVDRAERVVLATNLKHAGLVEEAIRIAQLVMQQCPNNIEWSASGFEMIAKIAPAWRSAHNVRRWMVQKHQESPTRNQYKRLADDIIKHASFLLRLCPALQAPNHKPLRLAHVSHGSNPVLHKWKAAINCMLILRFWSIRASASCVERETRSKVFGLITSFVTTEVQVEAIQDAMQTRHSRVLSRVKGFQAFQSMLSTASCSWVMRDILSYLSVTMRTLSASNQKRDAADSHYSCNTKACGVAASEQLKAAFSSLYIRMTALLDSQPTDSALRRLILDSWFILFQPSDVPLLLSCQLLPKLCKLLFSKQPLSSIEVFHQQPKKGKGVMLESECIEWEPFNVFAWNTFRLIAVSCVQMEEVLSTNTGRAKAATKTELAKLRAQIFEILYSEIERPMRRLESTMAKRTEHREETIGVEEFRRREATQLIICRDILSLLVAMGASTPGQLSLSSPRCQRVLLSLLKTGASDIQKLAIALAKRILPLQQPDPTDSSCVSAQIIQFLLDALGSAMVSYNFGKHPSICTNSVPYRVSLEIFEMFKTLLEYDPWLAYLRSVVNGIWLSIPDVVNALVNRIKRNISNDNENQSDDNDRRSIDIPAASRRIVAAFTIISGFPGVLEEGVEVLVQSREGIEISAKLIRADYDNGYAKVRIKTNTETEEKKIALNEITTLSEVAPPPWLPLSVEAVIAVSCLFDIDDDELFSSDNHARIETLLLCFMRSRALKAVANLLRDERSLRVFLENGEAQRLLRLAIRSANIKYGEEIGMDTCTYTFTGRNYVQQHWFHCNTCGLVGNEGICAVCAFECHKGHAIVYAKCSNFYCDCGSGSHKIKCKCLKPQKRTNRDSAENLERQSLKIGELILLAEEIANSNQKKGAEQKLPFLPYAATSAHLPTKMLKSDLNPHYRFKRPTEVFFECSEATASPSMIRSDYPIPLCLPIYYFEVDVVSIGGPFREDTGIAIGLAPSYHDLTGFAGWYNGSIGYHADDGFKYSSRIQEFSQNCGEEYGPPYGSGDTVGCGYIKQTGTVFFTKNGVNLGNAFHHVKGKFYPVISTNNNGARFRINFGQRPFLYNVKRNLPDAIHMNLNTSRGNEARKKINALEELELLGFPRAMCKEALELNGGDLNAAASWLTDRRTTEIRKKMAEDLSAMGFPLKVCLKALKLNGNDMQAAAAWLVDKGQGSRFNFQVLENEISSEESLDDLLAPSQDFDETEEFYLNENNYFQSLMRALLDKDPTVESRPRLDVDKIEFGSVIQIKPSVKLNEYGKEIVQSKLEKMTGRTGIVIEKIKKRIEIMSFELYSGTITRAWIDAKDLGAAHEPLRDAKFSELTTIAFENHQNLSVLHARKIINHILENRPTNEPSTKLISLLGGAENIRNLLKVKFLVDHGKTQKTFLEQETNADPSLSKLYNVLSNVIANEAAQPVEAEMSITSVLFTQCMRQLNKYSEARFHLRIEESRHPFHARINTLKEIRFWGAESLCVIFDKKSQCCITSGGPGAVLSFFYDQECTKLIAKYEGTSADFNKPLVVPADRFWYTFKSVPGTSTTVSQFPWGFRFIVTPYNWVMDDNMIFSMPNIHLGTWLFDVLTSNPSAVINLGHMYKDLFDSGLRYLLTPKTPLKVEVCHLLARMADHILSMPIDQRPSLQLLTVIRKKLERFMERADEKKHVFSPIFMAMLEMMVAVRKSLESDLCTFVFTGENFREQHIYNCGNCGLLEPNGCCSVCARSCHHDHHDVSYMSYSRFYCDCGAGNATKPCKSKLLQWRCSPAPGSAPLSPSTPTTNSNNNNSVFTSFLDFTPFDGFQHLSWFDKFAQVAEVVDCLVNRKRLPLWFIYEAWLETQKQVVVRESPHPYKLVKGQGKIHIPNASSLVITFDKRSKTDPFESLVFSKNAEGEDDLGGGSGEELSYKRIVVNGDTVYYAFKSGDCIHEGICCDGCGVVPIRGPRYKCASCEDFDWCEKCWKTKHHGDDPSYSHIFLKLRRPVHLNPAKIPCLYPEKWMTTPAFRSRVHEGVKCNNCGKCPIEGIRYRCENCHDYNLCEECGANENMYHDRQHVFLTIKNPLPPDNQLPPNNLPYGLLYRKERDTYWGYSFTVSPAMTEKDTRALIAKHRHELEQMANADMSIWGLAMDQQLVEYINTVCETGWMNMSPEDLKPTSEQLMAYPLLSNIPESNLQARFVVLKLFNSKLSNMLHLVNFNAADKFDSIGAKLCKLRGLIFYDTKLSLWNKVLNATHSRMQPTLIQLNRLKAAAQMENPDPMVRLRSSLFMQAFKQLQPVNPALLSRSDRGWKVSLLGEGSDDYGGPYRESITHICREIQSETLPLFLETPNNKNAAGYFREKYMPNPALVSPSMLEYYEFIGKIMGVALRTRNPIPLDFPSIVWKPLVRQPLDLKDLEAIDQIICQSLDVIINIEREGITEDDFEHCISSVFTTKSVTGRDVELIKNGSSIPVTFHNRFQFVKLTQHYRLNECAAQVEAMRRGLTQIVPSNILPIFSWQELELLMCGKPEIDLIMLKRHTVYEGYTAKSRTIIDFWKALESYSQEERSMFLKFVWGRSRLPLTDAEFDRSMKIQILDRPNPDQYLPLSHTCFFSLELPRYSSYKILRERVLYAIMNCRAIDTDFTTTAVANRNMGRNNNHRHGHHHHHHHHHNGLGASTVGDHSSGGGPSSDMDAAAEFNGLATF